MYYFADQMAFSMKLRGPLFRCELNNDDSLLLHYYSSRIGFPGIVKGVTKIIQSTVYNFNFSSVLLGIVREISRRIFGIEIEITIESRLRAHFNSIIKEHIIFSITRVSLFLLKICFTFSP
ncbi:unnamed protein product [Brugia timori]|uniref:HNOB domain-containing protein n=1 Tax=Brugia timori TaxID=42155 RepID=A0A0R3R279_9BILA|nr:unnamed protein product [Brugia timori]